MCGCPFFVHQGSDTDVFGSSSKGTNFRVESTSDGEWRLRRHCDLGHVKRSSRYEKI